MIPQVRRQSGRVIQEPLTECAPLLRWLIMISHWKVALIGGHWAFSPGFRIAGT
jgi:hypothetical protein